MNNSNIILPYFLSSINWSHQQIHPHSKLFHFPHLWTNFCNFSSASCFSKTSYLRKTFGTFSASTVHYRRSFYAPSYLAVFSPSPFHEHFRSSYLRNPMPSLRKHRHQSFARTFSISWSRVDQSWIHNLRESLYGKLFINKMEWIKYLSLPVPSWGKSGGIIRTSGRGNSPLSPSSNSTQQRLRPIFSSSGTIRSNNIEMDIA